MTVRFRAVAAVLVPLAFLSIAARHPSPAGGSRSVDEAWRKAALANDADALTACYAPAAVLWQPNGPEAKGRAAIHDAYKAFLDAYSIADASLSDAHYETRGDLSTGWGHFALTLKPKAGGDEVHMTGRFTDVCQKVGGRWLYVADHASADPAPSGAEK